MATLLSLCGFAGSQMEPLSYYFRELKFDARGHSIRLQRLSNRPSSGSYYRIDRGGSIDTVEHIADVPGQHPRVVLQLGTDSNRILLNTTRVESIASGPFGTVSLQKDCYYNRRPASYGNGVGVDSYLKISDYYASPTILPALPLLHPKITEISLIRIYQVPSGFLMATASYEAAGELGVVSQSTVKPGGDFISGTKEGSGLAGTQVAPHLQQLAETLGLLPKLSAEDYMKLRMVELPASTNPEVRSMVVLQYGFDDMLQVDTLLNGQSVSSLYLAPQVTKQDRSLNERCNTDLEKQLASGQRTTR